MAAKRIFILSLALILLISGLGFSVQPAQAATCTKFHTVKQGEYLVLIARQYDTTWRTLAEINDLKDPTRIYPGQKLCVAQEGSVQPTPTTERINFQLGATSATVTGHLSASGSRQYALAASAGQTMTVDLSFTKGKAILAIWGADGDVLLSDHAEATHFEGVLPKTQDYNILLKGRPNGETDYSMKVTIPAQGTTPTQPANCTQFYTVQKGEYLVLIGRKLGIDWRTIAEINKLANPSKIFPGQKLCVATGGTLPPTQPPSTVIPTFKILSVVEDESVTIQGFNFPANQKFNVLMGPLGTQGIGGKLVDTISTGNGGTFTANFRIPASLRGSSAIAIRLESTTTGTFSYNWFSNTSGGTGGIPVTKIPSFTIQNVVEDESVTIRTNDFPANMKFVVRMNVIGTRGIGGLIIVTKTFEIPPALQGLQQIAIRLDSTSTGHFAYNWFWNNTAGDS
jgi:LysM repeat protein